MNWIETLDTDTVGWTHLHFSTDCHCHHVRVSIHVLDFQGQNVCWSELQIDNEPSFLGPVFDQVPDFNPYSFKDEVLEWAEDKLTTPFSRLVESLKLPTDQIS